MPLHVMVGALAVLLVSHTPAVAQEVETPWSCIALGRLHGIDVPARASIEDAKAGLARAEARADAHLPGVQFCLRAARKAIHRAEKRK